MIIIFTHIKFLLILSPARNARKYVLHKKFYVYSIYIDVDKGQFHELWPLSKKKKKKLTRTSSPEIGISICECVTRYGYSILHLSVSF